MPRRRRLQCHSDSVCVGPLQHSGALASKMAACPRSRGLLPFVGRTMPTPSSKLAPATLRFKATLLRPAPGQGQSTAGDWSFLVLPKSVRLPSRGMVSVEGTLNAVPFKATLDPDGEGGHWLKVSRALREKARLGALVGVANAVTLELTPVPADKEPEPKVPPDFRKALAAIPGPAGAEAREAWKAITPIARRDWIQWITSGKKAETRGIRIEKACDMLAKGKKRPCCFDRSGMYDGSLRCPAAEDGTRQ